MLNQYWVHLCVQSNTLLTHSRCILHVSQQGLQNTLMYKIYLRRAARKTLHPAVQALKLAKMHTNTHNLYSCGEFANLGRQLELFVRLVCGNQEVARGARQFINCKKHASIKMVTQSMRLINVVAITFALCSACVGRKMAAAPPSEVCHVIPSPIRSHHLRRECLSLSICHGVHCLK